MSRRERLRAAGVEEVDAGYAEAAARLAEVPEKSDRLDPKTKALIRVSLDAAVTHLAPDDLRDDIVDALAAGATRKEVAEVLELTSVLGVHTTTVGVPILLEELAARGEGLDPERTVSAREKALKEEFVAVRGYWSELWDGVLALDPDFFEAYFRFSAVPFEGGELEPKVRELVYIAIDASTTHLFQPGIRIHIRNALEHGASAAEVMQVLELTALQGIKTAEVGMPILLDESRTMTGGTQQ
ncbi:MAG: carboxymuconolactone decarboxylase family protein [Actinobacteria bacterium]|nr:carboxymuconolactone decarboxylase family protein [Actinomycetota bacterium]